MNPVRVLAGACVATARPSALAGACMVLTALVTASWTAVLWPALAAAGWGTLVWWLSLAAHEGAHLLVLRLADRDRSAGALMSTRLSVWVIAPPLPPGPTAAVAIAGPLAGAAACAGLALVGVTEWICWGGALAHLANLAPFAPDGRALLGHPRST